MGAEGGGGGGGGVDTDTMKGSSLVKILSDANNVLEFKRPYTGENLFFFHCQSQDDLLEESIPAIQLSFVLFFLVYLFSPPASNKSWCQQSRWHEMLLCFNVI